jgi:Ca2+-binding RTX toxin-like protein
VGTAKADVIKARGGNDRVKGGGGRDRLWGGRGADSLNAVDGARDRVVNGGPGKDVCRVDATDRATATGCETVKVGRGGGPGPRPGGGQSCASPPEEPRLEAAQLIGGDGVALISSTTQVFDAGGRQLTGDAATAALVGADTVSLRA